MSSGAGSAAQGHESEEKGSVVRAPLHEKAPPGAGPDGAFGRGRKLQSGRMMR